MAKKLDPDIIANTGVNGTAFNLVIAAMENAEIVSSKQEMLEIQKELQQRSLYAGTLDGTLGRETRAGIVQFETSLGAAPTGLPTVALLRRLKQERVTPAHVLSNASGVVTLPDQPETTAAPPATAKRRAPPVQAKQFDPF